MLLNIEIIWRPRLRAFCRMIGEYEPWMPTVWCSNSLPFGSKTLLASFETLRENRETAGQVQSKEYSKMNPNQLHIWIFIPFFSSSLF